MRSLRIATRGSALALAQAEIARQAMERQSSGTQIVLVKVTTAGDRDQVTPLSAMPERGAFVVGLRAELLAGKADVGVHSLKDVPTARVPGLTIGGVLERGEARDVFISRNGDALGALPPGARVGTSSTRREAMLRTMRPDLQAVPLRGNVDSRLRRVRSGEIDGAILAGAGLIRLGRQAEITDWLEIEDFLPAPGQGALALECRADDDEVLGLLSALDHAPTRAAVTAERAFLAVQGENCSLPVGAFATVDGDVLHLRGTLSGAPGAVREAAGDVGQARAIGERLGREMRALLEGAE